MRCCSPGVLRTCCSMLCQVGDVPIKKCGVGTLLPSGGGRKRRLLSLLIAIAITACDKDTEAMMNVGDNALGSADVEGPTATHRYFADIGSLLGPTCDNG